MRKARHLLVMTIALLALSLLSCTNPDAAKRALDAAGYKDARFTGYDWFACSDSDFFSTGFIALGPTGHPVE